MAKASIITAAVALGLAGPAAAQAQDARKADAPLTAPEVRAALEAKGYTHINDVEFDDGMWEADARSADGQRVDLRVDPATGEVYPEDRVSRLGEADVRARLAAAGYGNVHDVEFDDGVWTAEAEDAQGRDVKLTLDPDSGDVVGEERD